jgi:hypothetical protein
MKDENDTRKTTKRKMMLASVLHECSVPKCIGKYRRWGLFSTAMMEEQWRDGSIEKREVVGFPSSYLMYITVVGMKQDWTILSM